MTRRLLGTLTVAAVMMGGCTDRSAAPMSQSGAAAQPTDATPAMEMAPPPQSAGAGGEATFALPAPAPVANRAEQQSPGAMPAERKLIRNGDMTIEVKSVAEALARVREIMQSVGGQATNQVERQNQFGGRTASVTCRVPAQRLDAAIDAARGLGEPRALSFATEDVTTSYFDVSVRINTQKQLERQLVALLQRPSNRLSDLLEIEREAARVREEIDRLEGRIRMWDNQIAMSSLQITLQEPAPIVAGTGGGPLVTLLASFGEAAENFVLTVAGLIAVSGSVLPIALVVGGIGWLVARFWRRRRAAVEPVTPAPAV